MVRGDTREHNDKTLRAVLNRLQDHNLTLNKDKCASHKTRLYFFRNIFTKAGMSPDLQKVKTVKDATPPQNVSEVGSFLGMTSYWSKYILDYATVTAPLRKLTRKNSTWTWRPKQQDAFEKRKHSLAEETVLSYFNPRLTAELVVDLGSGLGAILAQSELR